MPITITDDRLRSSLAGRLLGAAALSALVLTTACGGSEAAKASTPASDAPTTAAPAAAASAAPVAPGQVPADISALLQSIKAKDTGQLAVSEEDGQFLRLLVASTGRNGTTVRVGEATPLRTAVQLAEKLRASGYDARVVAEAARAGEVSLRHGNFASRAEAEAASREIARLGVPNEVIQIR